MKLTNNLRDAFINAVMADVPTVDYQQQIRNEADRMCREAMPPKLRALLKDPECEKWINREFSVVGGVAMTFVCYAPRDNKNCGMLKTHELQRLRDISDDLKAQDRARQELRGKLRSAAYSVTTRKALVSALPEFEKYLPPDEPAACRALPAVANVVADFVKAGWPKGEKPAGRAGVMK